MMNKTEFIEFLSEMSNFNKIQIAAGFRNSITTNLYEDRFNKIIILEARHRIIGTSQLGIPVNRVKFPLNTRMVSKPDKKEKYIEQNNLINLGYLETSELQRGIKDRGYKKEKFRTLIPYLDKATCDRIDKIYEQIIITRITNK